MADEEKAPMEPVPPGKRLMPEAYVNYPADAEPRPLEMEEPDTTEPSGDEWIMNDHPAGVQCLHIDYEAHDSDTVLFSGPNAVELANEFMTAQGVPPEGSEPPPVDGETPPAQTA